MSTDVLSKIFLDDDLGILPTRETVKKKRGATKEKWGNLHKRGRRMEKKKLRTGLKVAQNKLTYIGFMDSDEWKLRREQYFSRHKRQCRICDTTKNIQLHHLTYERVAREKDDDLVPLCYFHHQAYHNLYGVKKSLRKTSVAFIRSERAKLGK